LRHYLSDKSASQVTRLLKRLRVHGIIKKVGKRYKYYLTDFGREAAAMALKLREMVVIPQLAFARLDFLVFCASISFQRYYASSGTAPGR
jgi:DNA-binding IclR family transcriptional regulator